MRKNLKKLIVVGLVSSLISISCSDSGEDVMPQSVEKELSAKGVSNPEPGLIATRNLNLTFSKDFSFNIEDAISESECGPTLFNEVIDQSVSSNLDQLGFDYYYDYVDFNFYYTITDESKQYFGDKGQYTNLVKKITRNLEKFWNMPNEIEVRGQHNNTLNDPEKIIEILTFWYGYPQEVAEQYADFFINYVNLESTFLIETPLISFDGFAISLDGYLGQGDLIVIGDGLVELASEAGVDAKVVWNGILAHEWAHQIQTNNRSEWYPNGAADNVPEATRTTELEADFIAAYYLTHKRGATYNLKRVQDFNELFFNIGDCGFTSDGHHGTPLQRAEAANQGYLLAKNTFPKGKILSVNEVHEAFINSLATIVN
ncbi:hypothetical protein [Lutibacter citreus]|uniref:hypothetical protein n=1 Tax=Lutibacter citreus TaxID=2138210 RepID=UPI000DBE850C|nr:hypothetical protein [Lutibacter citreus]